MNLRSIFGSKSTSRRFRAHAAAASRLVAVSPSEKLESRALLAGNVTAQMLGQTAMVTGDSADNSVELVVEAGNVVARGLDGTTINGSADDFVLATGATELPGSLLASLSSGNDTFVVNGVSVGQNVHVRGGSGNDTIAIQDLNVGGSVWMSGGRGNDLLTTSAVTIGRNLHVAGAAGSDDIVIDASTVNRDTRLTGWTGNDDIVVRNSTLSDDLFIAGHRGNDIILIDGGTVADRTRIHAGVGSDNVSLQGAAQFSGRVVAIGGAGRDAFASAADVSTGKLRRRRFSTSTLDTAAIDTRINDSVTGAIARAEAAVGVTLTVSVVPTTVSETDGTITDALTVTRSGSDSADLVVDLSSGNTDKLTTAATVTIPAGSSSVTTDIIIIDTTVVEGDTVVTITAASADANSGTVDVTITEDDTLSLTSAISDPVEQSNGVEVSRTESATLTGTTSPDAVIAVDRDGDGAFDDGTATADANGNYSVATTLLSNATNVGVNNLVVRATVGTGASEQTQNSSVSVYYSPGRVVRFDTNQDLDNDGTLDSFDIEMFDAAALATVDNFLDYTTTDVTSTERFDDLLLQRSDRGTGGGFIIQAGRYNVVGDVITEVDRDLNNDGSPDTITGEFDAANSNLRGTLSMALPAGNPDGGSSEWFINTVDNAFLDNNGHTVFGRVIGDGMDVVDALHAIDSVDLSALYGRTSLGAAAASALGDVPLRNAPPAGTALTGTVSLTLDSPTLTGTSTAFTTELTTGASVEINGRIFSVASVQSDTEATLTEDATFGIGTSTGTVGVLPAADDFLVFTNIGEILDNV